MKIKIKNIDWDFDEIEEDEDLPELPQEIIIETNGFTNIDDEIAEYVCDYIDENYGFCTNAYTYEFIAENEENAFNNVKTLIDDVMLANFCEDDPKAYLHYIEKDIDAVCDLKENSKYMEDECTYNHILEELYLLQDIIQTIYKGEE